MPCYHPLTAWDFTDYSSNPDKLNIVFGSRFSSDNSALISDHRMLLMPCRHCVGCRLARSREWSNRLMLENLYHDESWFLTLTYDDEYLPVSYATDDNGEVIAYHATLVKAHVQKFLKRLRFSGQSVRYFCAGEYGSHTYRPHYHIILFGLHLTDIKPLNRNPLGQVYYQSDFISRLWPFGYHILGRVTWQSCSYVARYTLKKATHGIDKSYYRKAAIAEEFQTMSLRPAIARQFYDDHPDIFDFNRFNFSTPAGGRAVTPPEYFRKLKRQSDPHFMVQRARKSFVQSDIQNHLKNMLTDNDYYDILKIEEERELSKLSSFPRNII